MWSVINQHLLSHIDLAGAEQETHKTDIAEAATSLFRRPPATHAMSPAIVHKLTKSKWESIIMKIKDKLNNNVTRRSVLKAMSAAAAAASLAGCGGGGDGTKTYYDEVVTPQDGLVFDREVTVKHSTGAFNCGGRCKHNVHVKNGRVLKQMSAGDIPRENSTASDESEGTAEYPVQSRGCVRCYGYVSQYYQPDRLKYPMIQRGAKGDINGFERVTWEEAIDYAAQKMADAIARKPVLGYTPIAIKYIEYDMYGFTSLAKNPGVAPLIETLVNESTGNEIGAMFDTIGERVYSNDVSDRLNTKFLLTWTLDASRTTYWMEHGTWFDTKVKESGAADMIVITTNGNDSSAMLSTGCVQSVRGSSVSIPGWITIRPATDGALAAAMCYVIYKNELYDENFIKDNCFGFYSQVNPDPVKAANAIASGPDSSAAVPRRGANATFPNTFTDADGNTFNEGDPYKGAVFKVPVGESFEEYLISLENEWGGAAGNAIDGTMAAVGDATYNNVLQYAAMTTGVKADVIEALAYKYATTKPARLEFGGGAQRAHNGVDAVKLAIALTAMTGNMGVMGGSLGLCMMRTMAYGINLDITKDPAILQATYQAYGLPERYQRDFEKIPCIRVCGNSVGQVALTGRDYRKKAKFVDDIKRTSAIYSFDTTTGKVIRETEGVDVSKYASGTPKSPEDKLVEIDVYFSKQLNKVQTNEDVNKTIRGFKEIPTVICCDLYMTLTAQHADVILPVSYHYERPASVNYTQGAPSLYYKDDIVASLYDTKTDEEIESAILKKLQEKTGVDFSSTIASLDNPTPLAKTYAGLAAGGQAYKNSTDPSFVDATFEEFVEKGIRQITMPRGKTMIPLQGQFANNKIGELENTTGKVNFYSPLFGLIRPNTPNDEIPGHYPDGYRNATIKYEPNHEGWESFFDNGNPRTGNFVGYTSPVSGRTYKLQYLTNKARNRGHTVFDNVAVIKDQFEQYIYVNPADAAERGISDGQTIYAYNDRGCTTAPAKLTHEIPPGVISIEHGAWYRAHPTETVSIWQQTKYNPSTDKFEFEKITVPVAMGGIENILTYDMNGTEIYAIHGVSAQGGACEISATKPE